MEERHLGEFIIVTPKGDEKNCFTPVFVASVIQFYPYSVNNVAGPATLFLFVDKFYSTTGLLI